MAGRSGGGDLSLQGEICEWRERGPCRNEICDVQRSQPSDLIVARAGGKAEAGGAGRTVLSTGGAWRGARFAAARSAGEKLRDASGGSRDAQDHHPRKRRRDSGRHGRLQRLEPSHALARAREIDEELILVGLSGRGDKDLAEVLRQ